MTAKLQQWSSSKRPLTNREKARVNQILLSQRVRKENLQDHWEVYDSWPPEWIRTMYELD